MHRFRRVCPTGPRLACCTDDQSTPLGLELDFVRQLRVLQQHLGYSYALGVPDLDDPRSGDHVITV
jgi:hypothetical protein